ncbi:hypothetical protein AYO21_10498 [Fonsecaea monophora]|uniref:Uncharacterized protein n=1 Tax=Fonsecaea monophora TaxID=254056 RepID=A0A177EUJ9_9EURO|nr:hypothetical protein AYO21_10498 [Fonsecaea monophora]OAG35296.1 hypothetical protein AYO21_10498 [Fonsecaea monophora]
MNSHPCPISLLQHGRDDTVYDVLTLSEDSSDDESPDLDQNFFNDDEEHLSKGDVATGLTTWYVQSWEGREAFRELYQNWKDAIISSFHLDPRAFRPVFKETRAQIQITVHSSVTPANRPTGELLGYIRFIRRAGTVELANFQAELRRSNLGLGNSTKVGNDELAGCHGEGFKLAALVLRRLGHSVKFAASEFYWNFGLRGLYRTNLYCHLSPAKPEKVEKMKAKYALDRTKPKFKRTLKSHIWEDVSVKIGKAKGDYGLEVSEDEFRSWLTVSVDLDSPSSDNVVQTLSGDLILDTRFAGRIYLKGLRIEGHSTGYMFGYNFACGSIGRDRTHLRHQLEETEILANIWDQAIQTQRPDLIDAYINLLRDKEDCPDVAVTSDKLSQESVRLIWERLKTNDPDAFFYCERDPSQPVAVDQVDLIPAELHRRPVAVSRAVWRLLSKFSLVRTPQEERTRLFMHSEPIDADRTPFSTNVLRALLASLALHPKLRDLRFKFVQGGGTDLDLAYSKDVKRIQIHGKWLSFQKVHEHGLCEVLRLTAPGYIRGEAFFCDHVVEDLFDALLSKSGDDLGISSPSLRRRLRRRMRDQLALMPRLVSVARTDAIRELEVRWIGNEGGLVSAICNKNICYHVTLHRVSTCEVKRNDVVHVDRRDRRTSNGRPSRSKQPLCAESTMDCRCAFQIVPRTDSRAIFTGLDPHEFYFPMVARVENGSFMAAPPAPVAPRGLLLSPVDTEMDISEVNGNEEAVEGQDMCVSKPEPDGTNGDAADNSPEVADNGSGAANQQMRRAIRREGVEVSFEKVDDQPGFEKDDSEWRRWHAEELPGAFAKLLARREKHHTPTFHPVASLECAHLDFHFVKDEYALVRLGSDSSSENVIFIHDISYCGGEDEASTAYLLVTKYSRLWSCFPDFKPHGIDNNDMVANQLELLLHFEDFDKMGLRDDAEVIQLGDIVSAADLMAGSNTVVTGVDHVLQLPPASHLLQRRDRWPAPQFDTTSRPSVVDFTPGVLGPAEGFSQAGFDIRAALGFDQERHLSWKIRHAQSQVYDGPPRKVLDDICSEQLQPLSTPNPAPPNIALVAGANAPFRLNEANQKMSSAENFVSQLDLVNMALEGPSKPDFLVVLSSPAVLHAAVVPRFLATIVNFLKHRRSVHMRLCRLKEHGLPQERNVLLLVASPFCAPLPWYLHWPASSSRPETITLRDLIGDLDFDNSRTGAGPDRAFHSPAIPYPGSIPDGKTFSLYGRWLGSKVSAMILFFTNPQLCNIKMERSGLKLAAVWTVNELGKGSDKTVEIEGLMSTQELYQNRGYLKGVS